MFVPLAHPPGDAQADFGEALVVIAGVQRKAHFLAVDLPHSDDAFVKAFPAETTEAFCEGHNAAFRYFGGVPRTIVYDNTKLAVAKILGDGRRQRTRVFSEHLALCRIERRPPRLDLENYPHLPAARVARTAADYLALLGRGAE